MSRKPLIRTKFHVLFFENIYKWWQRFGSEILFIYFLTETGFEAEHIFTSHALYFAPATFVEHCVILVKRNGHIFLVQYVKKKMQYIVTVALKYKMAKVHFRKVVDRGSSLKPRTFQRRTCFVLLLAASTTWQRQSTQIRLKDCCWKKMKPAVDEMFPEGAGPYVDLDEVCSPVSVSK